MSVEHVDITDPNIHDPKGFSTAGNSTYLTKGSGGLLTWQTDYSNPESANDKEIFVADGAGGGTFQQVPYGGLTVENRTTPVTITGSGGTSDLKVSDVLTSQCSATNVSSEFSAAGTGELTYTGTLTRHFHIVCQASIDLSTAATNSVAASIYWYDSSATTWARAPGSDAIFVANNSTIAFVASHTDLMLAQNDKLVLAVQNIGGSADCRLYTMYLFAMGMPGT